MPEIIQKYPWEYFVYFTLVDMRWTPAWNKIYFLTNENALFLKIYNFQFNEQLKLLQSIIN